VFWPNGPCLAERVLEGHGPAQTAAAQHVRATAQAPSRPRHKKLLVMKRLIRAILGMAGYRIEGIRYTPRQLYDPAVMRTLLFDDVVCRHMFEVGPELTFVQIGAYDGVSTDPLRKYIDRCGWSGVMLEPQPRPANQLRALYRDNPKIVILEAALDSERGTRNLYTIDSDAGPKWAGGMASFDRNHVLKHSYLVEGFQGMVRELRVDCVVFDDILDYLPEKRLDLLQIDAEGADGHILSLFPFDRFKPAIIQWEIKNMTCIQQEEALERVIAHGYRVSRSGGEDALAVLFPSSVQA
jgi:FkbM family methyltransferase